MYFNTRPIYPVEIKPSQSLEPWIHHECSLTDKLHASLGSFQLDLLSQHWITPSWWDKHLLQIKDEKIIQREIIMKSNDVEYWYARTIIPKSCYDQNPLFFNRLEHESLRQLIFDETDVCRVTMIHYPINTQCIEFFWVKKYLNLIVAPLWVRLTEYSHLNMKSFYLVEILLPELENIH